MRPVKRPAKSHGEKLKAAQGAHASPRTRFTNWLRGETKKYPVDLEPFTFSRQMDQASPLLFEMCCNSQSFASVTLIKRKAAGTDVSGRAFLRIDFKDVLVIGVDWDSGDVVKEKCKFICRDVEIQYQAADAGRHAGRCGAGELEAEYAEEGRRMMCPSCRRPKRSIQGRTPGPTSLLRWQADGLWRDNPLT